MTMYDAMIEHMALSMSIDIMEGTIAYEDIEKVLDDYHVIAMMNLSDQYQKDKEHVLKLVKERVIRILEDE